MLTYYWELGADILERRKTARWGSGFLKQLSADLMAEFPDMKGFSHNNLQYIKGWFLHYSEGIANCGAACSTIAKQLATQSADSSPLSQLLATLIRIPWWHNRVVIISKCKDVTETLYYVTKITEHNWSRSVLTH